MLKNYLLTAWKVFLRRKLFTFINLFGICLTLTIIVVATRVADNHLHPKGPEKNNSHYLVVSHLVMTNKSHTRTQSIYPGFKFINDYVSPLKVPEIISIYTKLNKISTYIQGKKIEYTIRRTDANYWRILDFEYVDGEAYSQEQFNLGKAVAVLNQTTAEQYFGQESAVGKTIIIQKKKYEIVGVVQNVPRTEIDAFSDIWLPFTTLPSTSYRQQVSGVFSAMLHHSNPKQLENIQQEFTSRLQQDFVAIDEYTQAFSHADNPLQAMARDIFGDSKSFENYTSTLIIAICIISFLFMLLPSINMVNLNISRILERASEIGVRKAYGATTLQLVWQFIVENVLLTLIGGVLALLFSSFILASIEMSGLIPYVEFPFNLNVFVISLLMTLVFSLVSGVYPAFKMAKLDPVLALKGGLK
ncbi:MAG: putative ABC transport system permease protein [Polaribacter sp.]|jgi:putative ABC transport system permease protein